MFSADEFGATALVSLPPVDIERKDRFSELWVRACDSYIGEAECSVVAERANAVTLARLRLSALTVDVSLTKRFASSGSSYEIHAPSAAIENGQLDLGKDAVWKNHPRMTAALDSAYSRIVVESWRGNPILLAEVLDTNGLQSRGGLRAPQVGALHALAAHWSVKSTHAKVVLPTGTGKTDVLIAASMMARALRTLVLVPSDALRTQVSDKFKSLGILRQIGAATTDALCPVVGKLTKSPHRIDEIAALRAANAVVSTTQMLLGMSSTVLKEFLYWFDLVMFDEAHHLPAASWTRIKEGIDDRSRVISVTATPYRNDGKRVPGELVYQFPLRLAQTQGYFTPISVVQVDENDPALADVEIARNAVAVLRRDEREHAKVHLILARARSVDHANLLHAIYLREFPDLDPVVLHTGVSQSKRRLAIEGLRASRHRVVVCVDMLGEGFDLPSLKIAAMHELHKSLPITLQFIGRFTRTASAVGAATVVINMAEPMAETAVAELFSEDADWNELVPELSARAIKSEEDIAKFLETMRASVDTENRKFDLALLTPKTNVTIYAASTFRPERLSKGISRHSSVHQSWLNEDRDLLVFVTQDIVYPDWSLSKDAAGFEWNMGMIAFDAEARLLYVNSTSRASRLSALAKAVGGQDATLISGEGMFRVFNGLHRTVLHNVGLYRRGQVRFQMLAGVDIGGHVSSAIQAGSAKSNLFAVGYDDGKKTNVGASFKGRVWSMSPTSIPDWVAWSRKVSRKIVDNTIATNSFLQFTLIPREVDSRPNIDVFAVLPPDGLLPGDYHGEKKISVHGSAALYSQVDLAFDVNSQEETSLVIRLTVGADTQSDFRLQWDGGFRVIHESGPRVKLLADSTEVSFEDYMTSHPPPLLLRDGSELVGKYHFKLPSTSPYTFSPDSIRAINWGTTPIRIESKWRNGQMRPSSVQGFMIDHAITEDNSFVIDDDDTGEAADIIVINDNRDAKELEVTLYHCKYASGGEAGARYGDLYEVCGQAVKSSRLLHRAEALLAHVVRREEKNLGGRPTRFEKGTLREAKSLRKRIGLYRMRLNICIVQPGLSAAALTPELSAVLAAADGFILEFTGRPLKVFGSL